MTEQNPITLYKEAEIAEEYKLKQSRSAWASLRDLALKFPDPTILRTQLLKLEDAYMEDMYGDVPESKTKAGKWKYAKFKYTDGSGVEREGGLPKAYRTAKSVLINGMKEGLKIEDDTAKSFVDGHLRSVRAPEKQALNLALKLNRLLESNKNGKLIYDGYVRPYLVTFE